jgi:hypothetical protein
MIYETIRETISTMVTAKCQRSLVQGYSRAALSQEGKQLDEFRLGGSCPATIIL